MPTLLPPPDGDSDKKFYKDCDIAGILRLSSGWVRKQRHHRRHGKEHVLTVDPVMIGDSPRYVRSEIEEWIATLRTRKAATPETGKGGAS